MASSVLCNLISSHSSQHPPHLSALSSYPLLFTSYRTLNILFPTASFNILYLPLSPVILHSISLTSRLCYPILCYSLPIIPSSSFTTASLLIIHSILYLLALLFYPLSLILSGAWPYLTLHSIPLFYLHYLSFSILLYTSFSSVSSSLILPSIPSIHLLCLLLSCIRVLLFLTASLSPWLCYPIISSYPNLTASLTPCLCCPVLCLDFLAPHYHPLTSHVSNQYHVICFAQPSQNLSLVYFPLSLSSLTHFSSSFW